MSENNFEIDSAATEDSIKINQELYTRLIEASKIMLVRESNNNIDISPALDIFIEVYEKENLNEVTDIYIAAESNTLPKKLKDTLLHAITSIIAFEYKEDNLDYLINIIHTDKDIKGTIALDYYLKMGCYHDKYNDPVLTLVENSIPSLSRTQLSAASWYLMNLYTTKNQRIQSILRAIEQKVGISFSYPKPEPKATDTNNQVSKPWWKIW